MYVIFFIIDEVIFSVPVQIYCDENSPEAKSKLQPEKVPNRPVPIVDDNITIRVPRYIFTFCFLYVHGVHDILHLKFQTCVIFQYQSFFILVNILSASKCARLKLLTSMVCKLCPSVHVLLTKNPSQFHQHFTSSFCADILKILMVTVLLQPLLKDKNADKDQF